MHTCCGRGIVEPFDLRAPAVLYGGSLAGLAIHAARQYLEHGVMPFAGAGGSDLPAAFLDAVSIVSRLQNAEGTATWKQ